MPGRQVIPTRIGTRLGERERWGAKDMAVKYVFGYCKYLDCSGPGTTARVWLSSAQSSREFDYPLLALQQGSTTLIACAVDIYKEAVKVTKACAMETVDVVPFPAEGALPGCAGCMDEDSTPREALTCLLGLASCIGRMPGEFSEASESGFLSTAIMKVTGLLRADVVDMGTVSSVFEALDRLLTMDTEIYGSVLESEIVTALGMAAARIKDAALGDSEGTSDLGASAIGILARSWTLFARYHEMWDASEDSVDASHASQHENDEGNCLFGKSVLQARDEIAMALADFTLPGHLQVAGNSDYRVILETIFESIDHTCTFVLSDPSFSGEDGARHRKKGLRRSLKAAAAAEPSPEISIPLTLPTCAKVDQQFCPRPLVIEASYIRDATYLLSSMRKTEFVEAAARFAGISSEGLLTTLVSGQLGIQLWSRNGLSTLAGGMQREKGDLPSNTTAELMFPLDSQVGSTSTDALHLYPEMLKVSLHTKTSITTW